MLDMFFQISLCYKQMETLHLICIQKGKVDAFWNNHHLFSSPICQRQKTRKSVVKETYIQATHNKTTVIVFRVQRA